MPLTGSVENENTHGLILQYFRKQRPIQTLTQKEIQQAMNKLHNRPQKALRVKIPNPGCFGITPLVALAS